MIIQRACTRASRTSGWLSVVAVDGPLEIRCSTVVEEQRRGLDPTGAWRDGCARDLQRQYGARVSPAVSATFVLQWYAGAVASAMAHLAVASRYLLDMSPERLSLGLSAPGGYPTEVGVQPGPVSLEPRLRDREAMLRRAYDLHVGEFAETYAADVKMSSQHRAGSVEDAWQSAWAAATRAALGWPTTDRWRASCCFIYALPGAHECARCPRLRQER
ncbi:(2Fe-2S)-binding protein [Luteipulveratus mongoliensis]|uniref:Ferric siderophore reductase C-terminal domain-containing protein n=1 Tax=Luteipulveratus mongoliensis TaxID=571913 RepID=A0A0K1JN80_9MICO|nr:(2Fe-2S)-binding protein [Luteipulveratus mongoliensis]AKU18043.1 hypothetical protein VV02_22880 [Luteipulveratus mongoliensis]